MGIRRLFEEFSKFLDRMEANHKRVRAAIERSDEIHAKAEESIRKSRELLQQIEEERGSKPQP